MRMPVRSRRPARRPGSLPGFLALCALLAGAPAHAEGTADWLFPPLSAAPERPLLRVGSPAPALEWQNPAGGRGRLPDLRGEVVVVVFWASWCTWCHRWWPVLDALTGSHAARPRVLPLNIRDEPEAARAYLRRTGLTWPLRQATEATAELWQAHATPHTVVVDASGHISGVISGFDPEGRALGQALDIALAASERMSSSP